MTEGEVRGDGNRFLPLRRSSATIRPPPDPDWEDEPLTTRPKRSITPRGQRFSKLSDAYLTIATRFAPKKNTRKALEQVQSGPVDPAQSSVAGPRLVRSQDELQIPNAASAMRSFMKRARGASLDATVSLGEQALGMVRGDIGGPRPDRQIHRGLPSSNGPSQDTTSSTINRIVAQYDGSTSSLKAQYDNTREHCWKRDVPNSLPPQTSLPDAPPSTIRQTSYMPQSEYDSPIPNSSITDSQHLLDADAQVHELDQARRTLFPSPLNIARVEHDDEMAPEQHHFTHNGYDDATEYEEDGNPFAHPEDGCYKTYLEPPMQRDISQEQRCLGSCPEPMYDSNINEYLPSHQEQSQASTSSPSNFLAPNARGRSVRNIKVVIGRDSAAGQNDGEIHDAQIGAMSDRRNMFSEDDDWVTEATSDVGFGTNVAAFPARPFTLGFKRSGSSLANYSDDEEDADDDSSDEEDADDSNDENDEAWYMRRYGSHERMIQHPEGGGHDKLSFNRRPNEPRFANMVLRRQNALPGPSGLRWASTAQEEVGQFRPQALGKHANPYQELESRQNNDSGRLVFNFDQNAPPRYEFRDSVSEYEPAAASTKVNCTYGSLPSLVPDIAKRHDLATTNTQFDRSADFEADRNPSPNFPRLSNVRQDTGLGVYTGEEPRTHVAALNHQEFAAASSYYDQPTANSVRSKFDFELLPLDQAQKKNKSQRYSGEINETEPTAARLKRKQSVRSPEPAPNSPAQPARAFFTSPELSENFSSPDWQTSSDLADIPTPFSDGRSEITRVGDHRQCQKVNSQATEDNSSSLSMSSPTRSLWYGQKPPCLVPTQRRRQYGVHPTLIAPDDYVSDRADTIRRSCFYVLAVLSILPFVGVLVLTGAFSDGLKWATRGEVDRLSSRQQRFIKWVLIIECILYTAAVVAVVVFFVLKSKGQN